MCGTDVCEKPSTAMPFFSVNFTPAASSPRPRTFGHRPTANMTLSTSIELSSLRDVESVLLVVNGFHHLSADDLDAAVMHLGAEMRAQDIVEAAQNVHAAIDQRHLRAEAVKDAGE